MDHSCRLFWDTLDLPKVTPLTSDTPRLRQHVSRSPVARRHENALSTKATQIPMALQRHERCVATRPAHRERRVATRSAHTRSSHASISYDNSSKSKAETPIGAYTSHSPAKQFRDSSPSTQFPAPATALSASTRLTRYTAPATN